MLTYCTNIHPGESWDDITGNVWPKVLQVKQRVSPDAPFPVGLRLSALAARQAVGGADAFLRQCSANGCYVPTINGFPYGPFHRVPVKEHAYLPDWRHGERVAYTRDLIRLLRHWLPQGLTGSISTVPVGLRRFIGPEDFPTIRTHLTSILTDLAEGAQVGKRIVLALEPEPGCYLETMEDLAAFVERLALPESLRPFLGACFDCCHGAVAGEEPRRAFALLAEAGIPLGKVQVSSAVRLSGAQLSSAELFCDGHYLHQTRVKAGERTRLFLDLPEALHALPHREGEWLIHYHLPIYDGGDHRYGTTNAYIHDVLGCCPPRTPLEVETYTWQSLPPALHRGGVVDAVCREFHWLKGVL